MYICFWTNLPSPSMLSSFMAGPFLACIILPRFHFGTFEHVAVAWQWHTWCEKAAGPRPTRMYPVWCELSSDLTRRPESVEWVSGTLFSPTSQFLSPNDSNHPHETLLLIKLTSLRMTDTVSPMGALH